MLTEKYSQFNAARNSMLGAFFGRIHCIAVNLVD